MESSTKDACISVRTTEYMSLLRNLCEMKTTPRFTDVAAIFREFRRCLNHETAKRSSLSPPYSPRASRIRVGNTVDASDSAFDRSCTWDPDKERCWIVSDLELWNSILVRGSIELREHAWGELTLQGCGGLMSHPERQDVLRASFLIHLLLRQHRCVTAISLDMSTTLLETRVLWHAIRTGAAVVKLLEIKSPSFDTLTAAENAWPRAAAALTNLVHLYISSAYITEQLARALGVYVEHASVLTTLILVDIKASERSADKFLRFVVYNRSLKHLSVGATFLTARRSRSLAYLVQRHVTLQSLQVKGTLYCSPSALLEAVVQSPTLTSLSVQECLIRAEDIAAMAAALTLSSRPPTLDAGDTTDVGPRVNSLKKLEFRGCMGDGPRVQAAYADLIGGK
ncbi:hypothetical protein HPB52_007246 [Rhipicephalus sanguineus]|uniref:Uncharacterized protein n=1 Tax=Rhipicephalus sanguineus TaxID=34632 RepID=A0A9D4QDY0_RHISA|nr:hypothetical protein HPB52_007246 [Rhipicephalus sanguineus]